MRRRVLRAVLFVAVLIACAMPAAAQQKKPGKAEESAADTACPADDRFARAGLRAFIDPQTGQLRPPTPEEAQALSRAARAEFAQEAGMLEAVVHPDGMVSVDLKGRFMQDLVVVRKPDGSLSFGCVPDSAKDSALSTPPVSRPAPALEER